MSLGLLPVEQIASVASMDSRVAFPLPIAARVSRGVSQDRPAILLLYIASEIAVSVSKLRSLSLYRKSKQSGEGHEDDTLAHDAHDAQDSAWREQKVPSLEQVDA